MLAYSRAILQTIGSQFTKTMLNNTLWRSLNQLGIARFRPTRRGCQAGAREQLTVTLLLVLPHQARNDVSTNIFEGNQNLQRLVH